MPSYATDSLPHTWSIEHNGGHHLLFTRITTIRSRVSHPLQCTFSTRTGRLLDVVHPEFQDRWKALFHSANHHVTTGVVAANNTQRQRYWRHWRNFLRSSFDPYLQDLHPNEKISIIQAFGEWTRQGNLGRGKQVKAGSVQDALGAIGKSFELAGFNNPLYQPGTTRYHLRLERQIEAFKQTDPPTRPQLAVPSGHPKLDLSSITVVKPQPHMCHR